MPQSGPQGQRQHPFEEPPENFHKHDTVVLLLLVPDVPT